ncbi:zinc finger MIZ domain-containing protein 1-like isoform X1 [Lates japonicus]|uniref:Zinc finger MIZ domain-containing protein 1-like isoform X1 n=1 Tax=Lates japonicus TaxID=270547 RepID=A0AAD3N119_LATJO|nr:zinc finger MIZ domain-containing protein 1-like isoform X1 [Lates japonicus]
MCLRCVCITCWVCEQTNPDPGKPFLSVSPGVPYGSVARQTARLTTPAHSLATERNQPPGWVSVGDHRLGIDQHLTEPAGRAQCWTWWNGHPPPVLHRTSPSLLRTCRWVAALHKAAATATATVAAYKSPEQGHEPIPMSSSFQMGPNQAYNSQFMNQPGQRPSVPPGNMG